MKTPVAFIVFVVLFDIIQADVPVSCGSNNQEALKTTVEAAKQSFKFLKDLKNQYQNKLIDKLAEIQKQFPNDIHCPQTTGSKIPHQIGGSLNDYGTPNKGGCDDRIEIHHQEFTGGYPGSYGGHGGFKDEEESYEELKELFGANNFVYQKEISEEDSDEDLKVQFAGNVGKPGDEEESYEELKLEFGGKPGKQEQKEDKKPGKDDGDYYEEYHVQYESGPGGSQISTITTGSPSKPSKPFELGVSTCPKPQTGKNPATAQSGQSGIPNKLKPSFPPPFLPPYGYPPFQVPSYYPVPYPPKAPVTLQSFGQCPLPQGIGYASRGFPGIPVQQVPLGYGYRFF